MIEAEKLSRSSAGHTRSAQPDSTLVRFELISENMGVTETIAASIVVLAIGGLTALAVRKPHQYRRLVIPLSVLVGLSGLLAIIYRLGGDQVKRALYEYITDPLEAHYAAEAVLPSMIWIIGLWFGSLLFLSALLALSYILGRVDKRFEP